MTSFREVEANRRNARFSAGPVLKRASEDRIPCGRMGRRPRYAPFSLTSSRL